jgi:hypothetical protein
MARLFNRNSIETALVKAFELWAEEDINDKFDSIDKRSAVNRNVKARIIVIRPKWTNWSVELTLNTGKDTFTDAQLKELINTTGMYVGICSYRTTNNGFFGRIELESLEKI